MKRGIIALVAGLAFSLVPPAAQATSVIYAMCSQDGITAAGQQCVTQFDLSEEEAAGLNASNLWTHVNYHDVPARNQAVGNARLEWLDPNGAVVFSEECISVSLHGDGYPGDIAGSLSPACTKTTPANAAKISAGTQTMVLTALEFTHAPAPATRLHGMIALKGIGDQV